MPELKEKFGMGNQTIDIIARLIDLCLLCGRFGEVDEICFDKLPSLETTLTILTATLPAKSELPKREQFFERATWKYGPELFEGLE